VRHALCVVNFVVAAAPTSTSIGAAVVASVGAAAALLSSNGVAPTVGAPHNTTSDRLAHQHALPLTTRPLIALHPHMFIPHRDQLVVEGIILDMRRLHQSRLPLGEAGKDSRNLTKQRMRAGKCLKSKLEELYIWEGFERDVTIDSLRRTDATIKQWIAGTDPDWVVQDSTLVSAKDLHHGRLWHEVTEDVKRCEEQVGICRARKARLQLNLQHVVRYVEYRITSLHNESVPTPLLVGMAWLLERHLARYNALLGQMQELIHIA